MKPWHAVIPRPLKRATYNARNRLRSLMLRRRWGSVNLDYQLNGLKIKIENRSDWIIYNEIFVKCVYDAAFDKATNIAGGQPLTVLDLGANVGFFALRLAYLAKRDSYPSPLTMTLVEGSPLVYRQLVTRIGNEPALKDNVVTVHGLAGAREGSAKIFESASFGAGNSLFAQRIPEGVEVPFVDITGLFQYGASIDLLKCDIEGSELSFLEHYPDLLQRVRVAVFEFHPELCDVARCRQLLDQAGFKNRRDLTHDMALFWK